jgi:hypothetical protein
METTLDKEKKQITENDRPETGWYAEARKQTIETLPDFLNHLINDYIHDYGTICRAVAAAALGAARAVNASPTGGITGFQAGCVMWEFIRQWMYRSNKCGLQIINYDDMLYPQYEYGFTKKTIEKEQWDALQKQAEENIANSKSVAPEILSHWISIKNGKVPFGYTVKD